MQWQRQGDATSMRGEELSSPLVPLITNGNCYLFSIKRKTLAKIYGKTVLYIIKNHDDNIYFTKDTVVFGCCLQVMACTTHSSSLEQPLQPALRWLNLLCVMWYMV